MLDGFGEVSLKVDPKNLRPAGAFLNARHRGCDLPAHRINSVREYPSDLSADMRVCQLIICKGIGSGSLGCVRRAGMAGQVPVEQADDLNLWVWCLEGGRSLVVDIRCWCLALHRRNCILCPSLGL